MNLKRLFSTLVAICALIVFFTWTYYPGIPTKAADDGVPNGYKCPGCSVILISIDTLRPDHLGSYGYGRDTSPFLDDLAERSMVFRKFYSPIPKTNPSHASMFTSKPPYLHGVRFNGQSLDEGETTLAEILGQQGYVTGGFASAAHLNMQSGFGQGFDTYDSGSIIKSGTYYTRYAGQTSSLASQWLESNRGERFFLFIHYFDPHAPYDPPKEHDIFQGASDSLLHRLAGALTYASPSANKSLDFLRTGLETARYDGEIHYVDAEIGGLLEQYGSLDDTVVIITSDHGEALGEHGYYFAHGDVLYEEQVRIPLIIYSRGVRYDSGKLSLNTQLMPTILDILDITDNYSMHPSLFAGESLTELVFESDRCTHPNASDNHCYPEMSNKGKLTAVRRGDWKYIHTPARDGEREELYDLVNDPGEELDESGQKEHAGRLDGLRSILAPLMPLIHDAEDEDVDVDEQTIEALRALGYVV
ncbi:sulfatase [Candidatus Altiarchaeota archaeon]